MHILFKLYNSILMGAYELSVASWVFRSLMGITPLLSLILVLKWPCRFGKYQSPIIILTYLLNLPNQEYFSNENTLSNLFTYLIYVLLAYLLNFRWFITSLSIITTSFILLVYYWLYMHFRDLTNFTALIGMISGLIYASYIHERNLKLSFLQLHQIKTMNEELKRIFDEFPEGIVLFDQKTKKLGLVNQEFLDLFSSTSPLKVTQMTD